MSSTWYAFAHRNMRHKITNVCTGLSCTDFLPFDCKHCQRIFCLEHRSSTAHVCTVDITQQVHIFDVVHGNRCKHVRIVDGLGNLCCPSGCDCHTERGSAMPTVRAVHRIQAGRVTRREGTIISHMSCMYCYNRIACTVTIVLHVLLQSYSEHTFTRGIRFAVGQVNEHIASGCKGNVLANVKGKKRKCGLGTCRNPENLSLLSCNACHENFCISHRFPSDHQCKGPATQGMILSPQANMFGMPATMRRCADHSHMQCRICNGVRLC